VLSHRKLTNCLITQQGFTFDREKDGVAGTTVDFYWIVPYFYAVFLDGYEIHTKDRQQQKDELITKALERRGNLVNRFMYNPPLSKQEKHHICDEIEQILRIKRYKPRNP